MTQFPPAEECRGWFRRAALALLIATALAPAARPAPAAGSGVRPFWGSEALWGYWEFGNDYVPARDWKVVSVSQEGEGDWKAANLIDGDPDTFYYPHGRDSYEVVIDLGRTYELGAFTVLTMRRPNAAFDSRMARYEFFVSDSKDERGAAVAAGAFEGAEGTETVVTFPAAAGRYVTLRAFARPDADKKADKNADKNADKEVCIRELRLVTADVVRHHQAMKDAAPARRRAEWEGRDSDEAVAALGRDFLDLLFCTPDEINRSNLRARPGLEAVGKLKAAGRYADGLRAFRDYYFDKLRRPQAFGLNANDVQPYGRGYAGISEFPQGALDKDLDAAGLKKQIAAADALLQGEMTLGDGGRVKIGEPGAIDWSAPAPPYGYSTPGRQNYPYRELWWGSGLSPLFTAYAATKDERYLKRWIAYMDDWAMNETFLDTLDPVLNHDNALYPVVTTIRMFATIAAALPYDSEAVPPAAFARIMRKLVTGTPLTWAVYMRSNGNGWTPGAGQMLMAMMIDEFKVAPLYFREARRRNIEDINVLQELRDGTETHQWPGYNFLLLNNAGALRLMDARESVPAWAQPAWERELHTVAWQKELREALGRRASYVLHWGTPGGEYPLVTHQEPPWEKRYKLRESLSRLPEMLDDPTNAKIYSTLYGDGAAGTPGYASEWFPYGGYSIARDGWGREDGYGAMFCSPRPGCGGVGSGCKNNVFGLAAFGMDLLADDLVHAYVRPTSPVQVDGRRQQFDFYVPKTPWPTAHRGDMVREWTDPPPWRWHASERFDLMEGVYSGVYANDFHKRTDFIDGVTHQRMALHARRAGLWVVTDRLLAAGKHDYEQIWYLPLRKGEHAGFTPDEIVLDPAARSVRTRRTGSNKWFSWDDLRDVTVPNVNLSMYQFTDAAPRYESKTERDGGEMYNWQRLGVSWKGEGDQQVVTALFPRKPTPPDAHPDGSENDLTSIKPLPGPRGVSGFEAVTPDGVRVRYSSAAGGTAALSAGGVEIDGEALLVVRGPAAAGGRGAAGADEEVTGIALGCKALKVKGAAVEARAADFEFSLSRASAPAAVRVEPIHRPISPVRILPESDVFVGDCEVTLQCDTPGVAMTYTLDGTEPTPQSPAYRGPFRIDRTRVVKARAYRPGVETNPPQTSGTLATPTSYAVFTRRLSSPAEQVTPKGPGLSYEYAEGDWKDLWLSPDKVQPLARGTAADLFDPACIPASNPPVGQPPGPRQRTYSVTYTGYLKVPEAGVYTLHAPHEYTHCDQVAGYELQVYLGHALNPDNNGVKRDEALNYWYPATRLHGFGTWSVPLDKGPHEFKVVYIDFRTDGPRRLNRLPGVPDVVWPGDRPALLISGPGTPAQPIPSSWLWR